MDETTENILLKKTGRNRLQIETIQKEIVLLKKEIKELKQSYQNLLILFEASGIEDREAYLRGEGTDDEHHENLST